MDRGGVGVSFALEYDVSEISRLFVQAVDFAVDLADSAKPGKIGIKLAFIQHWPEADEQLPAVEGVFGREVRLLVDPRLDHQRHAFYRVVICREDKFHSLLSVESNDGETLPLVRYWVDWHVEVVDTVESC